MNTWQQTEPPTHGEGLRRWRRLKIVLVVVALLLVGGFYLSYRYSPNRATDYADVRDHFKYGSIGSDNTTNGLPLAVMKVLPRMFQQHLPEGGARDYTAFGFIREPGRPMAMPIGFSVRRRIIDLVGLNCAVCHVGSVRESEQDEPKLYLAMPANTVNLEAYFKFLFACAGDEGFTPEKVLAEIEKDGPLFPLDRYILGQAIGRMKAGLLQRQDELSIFLTAEHPHWGPGRVDTFNPYKAIQFKDYYQTGLSPEEKMGTSDFPSVWNQRIREGMHLHWDGNNTSVRERNVSAAFGAGATRDEVDLPRIERVMQWLMDLPPPPFPFPDRIDKSKVKRGAALYVQFCFRCHSADGAEVGQVVPLEEIGTDAGRLNSYTEKLEKLQHGYDKGYLWTFKDFKKTDGYANVMLDGIWARAPYLHNGSVANLWELLTPAGSRRDGFYRGHDVYDAKNVGFRTDVQEIAGCKSVWFDTKQLGNGNGGHSGKRYGTELNDEDKWALIEYLKTL